MLRKATLFMVLWIVCNGCANNDPVSRPYIISQSEAQEQLEKPEIEN